MSQCLSQSSDNKGLNAFKLPSQMTIDNVSAILDEFKKIPPKQNAVIELNASALEHITMPGLQLLISLEKSFMAWGSQLILYNMPDSFIATLKDAGLNHLFGHRT